MRLEPYSFGLGSMTLIYRHFMKKLTSDQFAEYETNPLAADEKVRSWLDLPDNRYYTVSMMGPTFGEVKVNNQVRTVKSKKISKSDQK